MNNTGFSQAEYQQPSAVPSHYQQQQQQQAPSTIPSPTSPQQQQQAQNFYANNAREAQNFYAQQYQQQQQQQQQQNQSGFTVVPLGGAVHQPQQQPRYHQQQQQHQQQYYNGGGGFSSSRGVAPAAAAASGGGGKVNPNVAGRGAASLPAPQPKTTGCCSCCSGGGDATSNGQAPLKPRPVAGGNAESDDAPDAAPGARPAGGDVGSSSASEAAAAAGQWSDPDTALVPPLPPSPAPPKSKEEVAAVKIQRWFRRILKRTKCSRRGCRGAQLPGVDICDRCSLATLQHYEQNIMPVRFANGIVRFYERRDPFYELTNFQPVQMTWKGYKVLFSESAFQLEKFRTTQPKLAAAIAGVERPREGFDIAHSFYEHERKDWHSVREQVMLEILRVKFANVHLRRLLLVTGDRTLIEHSPHDKVWGNGGDDSGKNKLGELLMRVRWEIVHNNGEPIPPELEFDPATGFARNGPFVFPSVEYLRAYMNINAAGLRLYHMLFPEPTAEEAAKEKKRKVDEAAKKGPAAAAAAAALASEPGHGMGSSPYAIAHSGYFLHRRPAFPQPIGGHFARAIHAAFARDAPQNEGAIVATLADSTPSKAFTANVLAALKALDWIAEHSAPVRCPNFRLPYYHGLGKTDETIMRSVFFFELGPHKPVASPVPQFSGGGGGFNNNNSNNFGGRNAPARRPNPRPFDGLDPTAERVLFKAAYDRASNATHIADYLRDNVFNLDACRATLKTYQATHPGITLLHLGSMEDQILCSIWFFGQRPPYDPALPKETVQLFERGFGHKGPVAERVTAEQLGGIQEIVTAARDRATKANLGYSYLIFVQKENERNKVPGCCAECCCLLA